MFFFVDIWLNLLKNTFPVSILNTRPYTQLEVINVTPQRGPSSANHSVYHDRSGEQCVCGGLCPAALTAREE